MTLPDPAAPATGSGQRDLTDALVQASFAVMAVLNKVGAEHDLSLTQLRVLAILRDRRGKMSERADYPGLDKSTIPRRPAGGGARAHRAPPDSPPSPPPRPRPPPRPPPPPLPPLPGRCPEPA